MKSQCENFQTNKSFGRNLRKKNKNLGNNLKIIKNRNSGKLNKKLLKNAIKAEKSKFREKRE